MTRKKLTSIRKKPLVVAAAMTMASCSSLAMLGGNAHAATFNQAYVRYDRLSATTQTTGRVCAKPTTTVAANAGNTVKVTFPTVTGTDYVLGAAATFTVAGSTGDGTATAWTGIGTATNVTGKVVTFPFTGALTSGTLYCFNWNNAAALKTSSAAVGGTATESVPGTIATYDNTATLLESTQFSETIVSAGPPAEDQLTVSGTVPPSFTFALSGFTDPFGNLGIGAVQNTTGGRTVSMTTNGPNGWVLWVKNANDNGSGKGSLYSTTSGHHIAPGAAAGSANTLSAGTEGYGFVTTTNTHTAGGVNPSAGASAISIVSAYDGGAATNAGTLDPTGFQPVASSDGTAPNDVMNVKERAMITANTPAAGDYTDTITLVGAGRF
jgi:hypothetical protein